MFRRVFYEEWHAVIPIIAFVLTFGVFLYFVVRALRMKRSKADYMARLPLDQDGDSGSTGPSETSSNGKTDDE